jgi:ABC-type glycerol-3-phosphate transport system substrate-binding protein
MQKNTNVVQIVVLVVFGLGIILGVLFFSGKITLPWDKESETGITGPVTVWGVLPYVQVKSLFDTLQLQNKGLRLTYEYKEPEKLQTELVNALASGKGPDVFMMSPGEVAENIDRLYIVPYENYPSGAYKNTFIDAGDIFLTTQGVLAFPLFVDPMIMFYNRDILTSNYITKPPATWDELAQKVPVLTQKDDAGKIKQSTIALGTTNNISHARDLIVLKMLQLGNPITVQQADGWAAIPNANNALATTLDWFTSYGRSTDPNYSWNPSLPKDRDYFTAGNSAFYLGYPTELATIRQKNPNLNFAITMTPQESMTGKKVNYGRLYSIGVSKMSKNLPGAVGVVNLMTDKASIPSLLAGGYYVSARRDILTDKPKDNAEIAMMYNAAIISKTFLDPDVSETDKLILNTINQVNAGTKDIPAAIEAIASGLQSMVSTLKLPEIPLP